MLGLELAETIFGEPCVPVGAVCPSAGEAPTVAKCS